ncbi:hypothetical protein LX32DRAFT_35188 [Colletotrichum zoysiae]|uniref:Uncharacterized protein n=1 Tax=Colletotrichum zoysiae TaxID=1216348 RepID=A0AAD9M1P2_9PEZI|nr:hypothetical protein LX32DRAFT_35188 [Colletotrichum zoysiae]
MSSQGLRDNRERERKGETDRDRLDGSPSTNARYRSTSPRRTRDTNGVCGLARSPFPLAGDTHHLAAPGRGGTWNVGIGMCPVVPEPREARCRSEGRGRGRGGEGRRGEGTTGTRREQAHKRHDECSGQILHVWSETCRSALGRPPRRRESYSWATAADHGQPGKGRCVCVCAYVACWDEDATSERERGEMRQGRSGQTMSETKR